MDRFERVTISLPRETAEGLRQLVSVGGYESAGQLVHLALREWVSIHSSDERRLESLRAAIKEGEESGPGIPAEQVYAELEALISSYEKRSEALEYAPRALRDLRSIGEHIGADNPARARSFVTELMAKAEQAAERPKTFTPRDEISPGLRSIPHKRYILFFSEIEAGVRIERGMHSAQKLSPFFLD